jgi:hypothetical protein
VLRRKTPPSNEGKQRKGVKERGLQENHPEPYPPLSHDMVAEVDRAARLLSGVIANLAWPRPSHEARGIPPPCIWLFLRAGDASEKRWRGAGEHFGAEGFATAKDLS